MQSRAAGASPMLLEISIVIAAISGGIGIYTTAVALGIRHGIDWDHIAAITDITSASATTDENESWLLAEPGLQLSDESHHLGHSHEQALDEHEHAHVHDQPHEHDHHSHEPSTHADAAVATLERPIVATVGPLRVTQNHATAFRLGTLYALGHGLVVTVLGVLAIVAAEFLPDWVDPIMERLVGVTL